MLVVHEEVDQELAAPGAQPDQPQSVHRVEQPATPVHPRARPGRCSGGAGTGPPPSDWKQCPPGAPDRFLPPSRTLAGDRVVPKEDSQGQTLLHQRRISFRIIQSRSLKRLSNSPLTFTKLYQSGIPHAWYTLGKSVRKIFSSE
jgi:hypothetical protein